MAEPERCWNDDSEWSAGHETVGLWCQLPKGHDGPHEATVEWETAPQYCDLCQYFHVPGTECETEPLA